VIQSNASKTEEGAKEIFYQLGLGLILVRSRCHGGQRRLVRAPLNEVAWEKQIGRLLIQTPLKELSVRGSRRTPSANNIGNDGGHI
jgi:hypothetical protein